MDADRASYSTDFVGLAIVDVTHGMVESPTGFWQYKNSTDTEWMNITVQSHCILQ